MLAVSTNYSWQSEVFFTALNDAVERQDDYGLLNAHVDWSWSDGRYSISLWGRNILEQKHITGSAGFPLVAAGHAGPPATYGLRLSFGN